MFRTKYMTAAQAKADADHLKMAIPILEEFTHSKDMPAGFQRIAKTASNGLLDLADEYVTVQAGHNPRPDGLIAKGMGGVFGVLDIVADISKANPEATATAALGEVLLNLSYPFIERMAIPNDHEKFDAFSLTIGGTFWSLFGRPFLPFDGINLFIMRDIAEPVATVEMSTKFGTQVTTPHPVPLVLVMRSAADFIEAGVKQDVARDVAMRRIKSMLPLTINYF